MRDRVFFRRIILWVEADLGEEWSAEVQADIAPITLGERLIVRDAYLRYSGIQDGRITMTLGNQKVPFSRSVMTSSSRRSLIERPSVGERPFGAPGRAISFRLDGHNERKSVQWATAVASAFHRPGVEFINIDGLALSESDWNEGVLLVGRAEWHPLGPVPLEQGAFDATRFIATVAGGTYYWRNDGDRNLHTIDGISTSTIEADLHDALGLELSGGMRAPRFSLDAEWQRVAGRTVDRTFTGGIFSAGETRLFKSAAEAGYLLLDNRLELLGAIDTLDIQARDAVAWRPAFGVNWYFRRHRLKFQFMYREAFNAEGIPGARDRSSLLQAQVIF